MAAWKQGLEPMTSPSHLPRLNSVSGRLYGALGVGWGEPLWMGLFYFAGSFLPSPLVETAAQQQMFPQGPVHCKSTLVGFASRIQEAWSVRPA